MVGYWIPLFSWVAVLMGRIASTERSREMKEATRIRPNVRRTKKPKNAVRADRVEEALRYYRVTGLREPGASVETVLSDLLSDLRHLCDREHVDLAGIDRMAHRNYLNEKFG